MARRVQSSDVVVTVYDNAGNVVPPVPPLPPAPEPPPIPPPPDIAVGTVCWCVLTTSGVGVRVRVVERVNANVYRAHRIDFDGHASGRTGTARRDQLWPE